MIFILSGPSGSGKTTLRDRVLKDGLIKKKFVKSVSLCTRPRRTGEKEGRDYFFVTGEKFTDLKRSGKILEWTKYLGYYYGTKKALVEAALKKGKNILLCLDFRGAKRVRKLYPKETLTIFVIPPSLQELRKRIQGRSFKTKNEEVKRRVRLVEAELRQAAYYDYSLRNINLKQAVKRLKGIILQRI
ncbi:MAG: guanylate kinase [Candidatus Omnitrophica bacterium]|nr:guanylate kinase [Candidatus Omnitrophota bacterium]